MAQFEIEIKLPLKNLKETLKFLTDQGFQETAQIQEEDTYFNSVYHDVKKRDEALRIRTSTDCRSGISKTQINFKGPKLDKISMSRMELETEVSDAEVLKNILIHLDFSPVASVMKTRKYMKCGRFTACLDQVEGLGDFLELEVIAEQESERKEILSKMEDLLAILGYHMSDTVQTSYLSMLPKKLIKIFYKPAGIFSCEYLRYRIRKCSCFFFSYNSSAFQVYLPYYKSHITKQHQTTFNVHVITIDHSCFLLLYVYFYVVY